MSREPDQNAPASNGDARGDSPIDAPPPAPAPAPPQILSFDDLARLIARPNPARAVRARQIAAQGGCELEALIDRGLLAVRAA